MKVRPDAAPCPPPRVAARFSRPGSRPPAGRGAGHPRPGGGQPRHLPRVGGWAPALLLSGPRRGGRRRGAGGVVVRRPARRTPLAGPPPGPGRRPPRARRPRHAPQRAPGRGGGHPGDPGGVRSGAGPGAQRGGVVQHRGGLARPARALRVDRLRRAALARRSRPGLAPPAGPGDPGPRPAPGGDRLAGQRGPGSALPGAGRSGGGHHSGHGLGRAGHRAGCLRRREGRERPPPRGRGRPRGVGPVPGRADASASWPGGARSGPGRTAGPWPPPASARRVRTPSTAAGCACSASASGAGWPEAEACGARPVVRAPVAPARLLPAPGLAPCPWGSSSSRPPRWPSPSRLEPDWPGRRPSPSRWPSPWPCSGSSPAWCWPWPAGQTCLPALAGGCRAASRLGPGRCWPWAGPCPGPGPPTTSRPAWPSPSTASCSWAASPGGWSGGAPVGAPRAAVLGLAPLSLVGATAQRPSMRFMQDWAPQSEHRWAVGWPTESWRLSHALRLPAGASERPLRLRFFLAGPYNGPARIYATVNGQEVQRHSWPRASYRSTCRPPCCRGRRTCSSSCARLPPIPGCACWPAAGPRGPAWAGRPPPTATAPPGCGGTFNDAAGRAQAGSPGPPRGGAGVTLRPGPLRGGEVAGRRSGARRRRPAPPALAPRPTRPTRSRRSAGSCSTASWRPWPWPWAWPAWPAGPGSTSTTRASWASSTAGRCPGRRPTTPTTCPPSPATPAPASGSPPSTTAPCCPSSSPPQLYAWTGRRLLVVRRRRPPLLGPGRGRRRCTSPCASARPPARRRWPGC